MMINRKLTLPSQQSFFLFGARQTGKSTLIQSLFPERIMSFDLLKADALLKYSKDPSLFRKEIIQQAKHQTIDHIFVDEIQRIPALLDEIQHLMPQFPLQFILTGSSARKLKRGGANLLAGRAIEYHLFPLTWFELADRFDLDATLRFGSLPPVVSAETDDLKADILSAYANVYLREEIQSEGIVRNLGGFARFLDLAAEHSGELLSFTSMARECQLPVKTVQNYYQILEDTLIGFRLMPWRKSLRKRLVAHPKFYLFDTGVTNAILRRLKAPLESSLKGKLFEQWLILETYRYLQYSRSEANMYFWRSNIGTEVDVMIEKYGKVTHAFEIKSTERPSSGDLNGLKSFREDHPQARCCLICCAEHSYESQGIIILPWQEFLKDIREILS